MTPVPEFQQWREENPWIEEHLQYPEGKDCRWARLVVHWREYKNGETITHICAFAIDLQTGNTYADCSKPKIWGKCVALTVGRPVMAFYKTLYHLAIPISIPVEIFLTIFKGIKKGESAGTIAFKVTRNVGRSLFDIVRTPFYSIALISVNLAAVLIGPVDSTKLYYLRALAGRIERSLLWGKKKSIWMMARCFQPHNIMEVHKEDYSKRDTIYDQQPTLHGLNNVTRTYVHHMRRNGDPFNFCQVLDPDTPYVSPAYQAG